MRTEGTAIRPRDEHDPRGAASRRAGVRGVLAVGALIWLAAVAMRVNNALRFRTGNGFDAVENVDYLRRLMQSWALPDPDDAWATSHPPLFYYLSAALWRALDAVGLGDTILTAIPLLVSAAGLALVGAAVWLVRRLAPGDALRALTAAGLLLFLPVHVYMSAMVSEELLAALWISLALITAVPLCERAAEDEGAPRLGRAAVAGLFAGLALLTKLTGVLVLAAIVASWLAGARRGRAFAVRRAAVAVAVALVVGGWFYLHNLVAHGYLYPQGLAVHEKMFAMPPGSRGVLDYVRLPYAMFSDPQLRNEALLGSVWGSTYDTVWFDGHRHFLERSDAVTRVGRAITVLALVPTALFLAGLVAGARRARRDPGGVDTLLVLLVAAFVAGYVAFTWANPWYVTLKGSYLLGLAVPFAVYASEALAFVRVRRPRAAVALYGALAALFLLVAVTFTIGPVFRKLDGPGLPATESLR